MTRIRELRQKRGEIAAEMAAMIPKGRSMSGDERQKFDLLDREQEELKREIDQIERANSVDDEIRQTQRPPQAPIGDVYQQAADSQADRRYQRAFQSFLRNGLVANGRADRGVSDEDRVLMERRGREFRDMGIGTGALGGYLVPQGFVYKVEEALKFFGQMLEAADIMDTATGNPLPYPNDNDTTVTGELVGEGQQVSTADVNVGHITFNAWKYSTKLVKVSLELLQDSAFPIEDYLARKFGIRLGRILNNHFTLGSGTSQPNGIITAVVANDGTPQVWGAGSGPGVPLIAAGSASNTGGSETGATSIGSDDLFNLEHSVDVLYRRGASYMMHDTTLRSLKTIKDKYGRPLWMPGLASGKPDTINGYPYWLNNDMDQIATGKKTVLFGQLKKYTVRRVKEMGVIRLSERFADYGQVAFIGFARYDGNLLDAGTHPVAYLQQA